MIEYRSKTYDFLVWCYKTWLPIASAILGGIALITGADVTVPVAIVTSLLTPVIAMVCRASKQGFIDIDEKGEN